MDSIKNVIKSLKQLEIAAEYHNLNEENLQSIKEAIEVLESVNNKEKVKDAAEVSFKIASVVKLIFEIFTNSS